MRINKSKYTEIDIEVVKELNIKYREKDVLPVELVGVASSIYLKPEQLGLVIKALQKLRSELKR